jgi:hypothetical protein
MIFMKLKYNKLIAIVFGFSMLLFSCKKDYIVGGEPEDINQYKNTSSYDVLKSNPLFDTLVQVIEAAGLKEKKHAPGTTFFVPSDYSIYDYLNMRTLKLQFEVDQNAKFGLDSLIYYVSNNINGTRDSLLMYQIGKPLYFNDFSQMGAAYQTELAGSTAVLSFEETRDGNSGYSSLVSNVPRLLYFTQLWYPYDLGSNNPASDIPNNIGVRTLVKASGIITQNGYLNVLNNNHTLFFYGTKQ